MTSMSQQQKDTYAAGLEREHAGYLGRKAQAEAAEDEDLASRMQGRAEQVEAELERVAGKAAVNRLRKGGAKTRAGGD